MEQKNAFEYTYSATQQEEVKKIREKYVQKEPDTLEKLRRLDKKATEKGTTAALSVGIISTLLFGFGMSCTLVWTDTLLVPGVIIGLVGFAGIFCAYPLYSRITKRERKKIAPEILRLSDELLK